MPRNGGGKGNKGINDMTWAPPLGQLQEAGEQGDWMQYMPRIRAVTATSPEGWSQVGKRGAKLITKPATDEKIITSSRYEAISDHGDESTRPCHVSRRPTGA